VAHPKISIVTPTYNCAKYLPQCIQSVLAQGYDNIEHIIVDGASSDDTIEILKSYGHVRWISEPDNGEAEALNKALKMATGDIITWLNADDYYVGKGVYQTAVENYLAHPEADVFYGNTLIIDDDENILEMRIPRIPLNMSQITKWFEDIRLFQPSIFYTRDVAKTLGPYREDLYYAIDLEYWLRIAAAGFQFHHIDQTFSKSRLQRPGAKSGGSVEDAQKCYYEICTSFVPHLPPGEAFNFWKEYYRLRILTQNLHKQPIPVGDTFEATAGLCFALIQLNQIQSALPVAETLIAKYPDKPESYWFASESLHKAGRHDDARRIAAAANAHISGGPIAPLPRPGKTGEKIVHPIAA
jgi:glycosyltransferase involved in cell wall biosynthesis